MTFKELQRANVMVVSMSDVIRHPWYQKFIDKPDGLKGLLYSMGLDINKNYETELCEHRSEMTNAIVTCERFVGTERTDDGWKKILNSLKK